MDKWAGELIGWAAWMTAAHRSRGTIELRVYHVRRLARSLSRTTEPGPLGPWDVTLDTLTGWLAEQGFGAETLRSYRASWAAFYRWGMDTGRTSSNPAALLPPVQRPRGVPKPASDDELLTALHRADHRTRLMLELAAYAGLRRAEVSRVRVDDLERGVLGYFLRVKGKGEVTRRIPITTELAAHITAEAPPWGGWLFPSPTAAGGPLTAAHVGRLMSDALGGHVTPHQLRHRFASRAYLAERDLRAVQELLGHARPETTAIYTAVPQEAGRRAVVFASRLAGTA